MPNIQNKTNKQTNKKIKRDKKNQIKQHWYYGTDISIHTKTRGDVTLLFPDFKFLTC